MRRKENKSLEGEESEGLGGSYVNSTGQAILYYLGIGGLGWGGRFLGHD